MIISAFSAVDGLSTTTSLASVTESVLRGDKDAMDAANACEAYERQLVTDELYSKLGQRYLSLTDRVVWGSIYSLLFVTGVLGNLATCIVVARNKYMHTATNMYLFNLAVGDLITLICGLPLELSNTFGEQYPFKLGSFFCSGRNVLSELSAYVSVLTITAFTVERYIAICHPLRAQAFSNFRRSVITIVLVWVISVLCALPHGMATEVREFVPYPNISYTNFTERGCPPPNWNHSYIPDSLVCCPKQSYLPAFFFNVSAFSFFFIPMVFISTLYILIGHRLYRSGMTRHVGGHEEKHKSRRMLIRMLVAVVSAFFICMAPFHLQRLISMYWTRPPPTLMLILFYLSGCLFYVSCTLNPVLYNLMSAKFRHAFKQTLQCCLPKSMRRQNRFLGTRSYTQHSGTFNSVISTRYTSPGSCRLLDNGSHRPATDSHYNTNARSRPFMETVEMYPVSEKEDWNSKEELQKRSEIEDRTHLQQTK